MQLPLVCTTGSPDYGLGGQRSSVPKDSKEKAMRCDQFIGLNEWASKRVSGTKTVRERGVRIFADGTRKRFYRTVRIPTARVEVISKLSGAWTDHVADLHRYTMPDGEVYVEYVQAEPWSSGPCYFIALRGADGQPVPESLWTEDDIDNA